MKDGPYTYTDEAGNPVFQVRRYARPDGTKSFSFHSPQRGGGWRNGLGRTRRRLYRLDTLAEAIRRGETIYIPEGEKDVESAFAAGAVATTNPGGAGKWRPEYSRHLAGADVVVVWDRDQAGGSHALAVEASLRAVVASLKLVRAREGKDLTEHLDAGYGFDDLIEERPVANRPEAPETTPEADVLERLLVILREFAIANARPLPRMHGDGEGFEASCPSHEDREPSLSVRRGDKQPVVLDCHAGCETDQVLEALGLSWADICRDAESPSEPSGNPTQASQVIDLIKEQYDVCVNEAGHTYAIPREGARIARPLNGRGGSLRAGITAEYFHRYDRAPNPTAVASAFEVIAGEALDQRPVDVHLRVVRTETGLVIDLGWPDGKVVIIEPGGWRIEDAPPAGVIFRRTRMTGALPNPAEQGDLDLLRELVNVTDRGWDLIRAWLVLAWMPDIPVPILTITGSQGAGKSHLGRTLVSVVDPGPALLRKAPKDPEDWITAAAGSRVVGLDNISWISEWLSDALCRAVTGEGHVKRMLYHDDDLVVFNFRRALLLTSIDPGSMRGDLGERLLPVELDPLDNERRTERQLEARAKESLPRILTGLLDLVVDVLANPVALEEPPRMADAAEVMASVDKVLGSDAVGAYAATRAEVVEKVLESDVVAFALLRFMEGRDSWEGTAGELYEILDVYAPSGRRQWPGNARVLSSRIKRAMPALENARGLVIGKSSLHGRAKYVITRKAS